MPNLFSFWGHIFHQIEHCCWAPFFRALTSLF